MGLPSGPFHFLEKILKAENAVAYKDSCCLNGWMAVYNRSKLTCTLTYEYPGDKLPRTRSLIMALAQKDLKCSNKDEMI